MMPFRHPKLIFRNVPDLLSAFSHYWHNYLSSIIQDSGWTVANYGYASLEKEDPIDGLQIENNIESQRYGVQLYRHITNRVDISGKKVLEVGCGRGGGAAYIYDSLGPASVTGIDISSGAIRFCIDNYQGTGLEFFEGTADSIAFPNESFDTVICVESSRSYRSMEIFLSEAERVLKLGGHLLFADRRYGRKSQEQLLDDLTKSGLMIIKQRDISRNVLRALELDRDRKTELTKQIAPRFLQRSVNRFVGGENSRIWKGLISGHAKYYSIILRKPQNVTSEYVKSLKMMLKN